MKTTLFFVITLILSTIGLSQTTYINYTDSINLLHTYGAGLFGGGVSFLDINNDLLPDIYTANDKHNGNELFINNVGTFSKNVETNNVAIKMSAMGIATGDFDNDGFLDIYVANTSLGNKFIKNSV